MNKEAVLFAVNVVSEYATSYSARITDRTIKIFLTRVEAEFCKWQLKKEEEGRQKNTGAYGGYSKTRFSIDEIKVDTLDKTNKDFKKFCKEKVEELEKDAFALIACGNADVIKANALKEQMKDYATVI